MESRKILSIMVTIVLSLLCFMGTAFAGEVYSFSSQLPATVSPGSANGQFLFPAIVSVEGNGNILVSDVGNSRIQRFAPNGTFLTKWGSAGTGNTQFSFIGGIGTDAAGNVYVLNLDLDTGTGEIKKFTSAGAFLTKWALDDLVAPQGIAVTSDGFVYALDGGDDEYYGSVTKYDAQGTMVKSFGQFEAPTAIAVDKSGVVYVADGSQMLKFDANGSTLNGFTSTGTGKFTDPSALAVDSAGNIFVSAENYLLKFAPNGTLKNRWGSEGSGRGQLDSNIGIAVDNNGKVYVADCGNNRVQVFSLVSDVTGPTGSVSILNGNITKNGNVTLKITAADAGSGVGAMMISNNSSFTGAAWVSYATTKTWNLGAGDGAKTVYVKFRDNAGNVSTVYSAKAIVDSKVPTGKASINKGAKTTSSKTVTLNISAVDASGISKMMISNSPNFAGAAWVPYAATKTWTMTPAKGTKKVYIKFMDKAGNISAVYTSTIVLK